MILQQKQSRYTNVSRNNLGLGTTVFSLLNELTCTKFINFFNKLTIQNNCLYKKMAKRSCSLKNLGVHKNLILKKLDF